MNLAQQKLREQTEPEWYRWDDEGNVYEIDNVLVPCRFLTLAGALDYLRDDSNWSPSLPASRRCIVKHYRKIDGQEVFQAACDINGDDVDPEAWWDGEIERRYGPYHVRFRKDGGGRIPSVWGRTQDSYAMKIHPSQVNEFNEAAKQAGTGAWYDKKGVCHFDSRRARSAEIKRRGFFDQDGGYGDYTGDSREYMAPNGVLTPGHRG